MKKVALLNQKGGVGKSTVGASLGVCAHREGWRTMMIDCDPQATWSYWAHQRGGVEPRVQRCAHEDLATMLGSLEGFDICFVDTAGEAGARTAQVMRVADLCLVPVRPTSFDLEATRPILEQLVDAKRRFAIVLCQAPRQPMRSLEAQDVLAEFRRIAGVPLVARVDHQDAMACGLGVSEYNEFGAAAAEIRCLWASVKLRLGLVKVGQHGQAA